MARRRGTTEATSSGRETKPKQQRKTNEDVADNNSRPRAKPSSSPTWWESLISTWLPNLLVVLVAFVAVTQEYTTSPEYVTSKPLMRLLKQAFIAFVCLLSRKQLATFYLPPNKNKTIKLVCWGHAKALMVVILANSAGKTVISPLFGLAPAYSETIELVIPVYFSVEIILGVFPAFEVLIQFIIGFLVSWLKAMTISMLVSDWQATADAHPIGFVLIGTANLFASGLVLRYVAHYTSTHRVLGLSFSMVWSIIRIMGISSIMGLIAHVANHFGTLAQYQMKATLLYGVIAWYTFNKYWKGPLTTVLMSMGGVKVKQF